MAERKHSKLTLLRGNYGLGFNIRGGVDQPHFPNDTGIFVTKVRENGAAAVDGNLKEGDKILEVNGNSLVGVTHEVAVNHFLSAGDTVNLVVWHDAEKILVSEYNNSQRSGDSSSKMVYFGAAVLVLAGVAIYYYRIR